MVVDALYKALYGALSAEFARVSPLAVVQAGMVPPYVAYQVTAHIREATVATRERHRLTVSVKGVADTLAEAITHQGSILRLLEHRGDQDGREPLGVPEGWRVTVVTAGRAIWLEEMVDDARRVYHAGYQFEIMMEAE